MLPSEELLNKYRQAEQSKSETAEPTTAETNVESSTGEKPAEESHDDVSVPAESAVSDSTGVQDGNKSQTPAVTSIPKEERTRYQRDWEKRLERQAKSSAAREKALNERIEKLEAMLKGEGKPLQREDFSSTTDYENYQRKQMEESIRNNVIAELEESAKAQQKADERNKVVQQRIDTAFPDAEQRKDFNLTMKDFCDDNDEFLESENGKLFQEFVDGSKVGVHMMYLIAKNPAVVKQLANWSKDMLVAQLGRFETDIINKKAAEEQAKQQAQQKKPSAMPSTGSFGGSTQATSGFNAREWLKKNRPERY